MATPLIQAPPFLKIPNIRHGFTTREGGVSDASFSSLNLGWATGDDDDLVVENYRILAEWLNATPTQLFALRQVHSADVIRIKAGDRSEDISARKGDAMITDRPNVFLMVRVADCLPILLADAAHQAVGVVHAGWRGTLEGILPKAIEAMAQTYGTEPAELIMALGPGISMKHYPVSEGVAELFRDRIGLEKGEFKETEAHVALNLANLNFRLALSAGVNPVRIWTSGLCSFSDPTRFYSYRRDGKRTGRNAGVIGWAA